MSSNNDSDNARGDSGGQRQEGSSPDGFGYRLPPPREIVDRLHVDLSHGWEVHLWTREFGCSEDDLRRAVKAAGNSARDVKEYLRGRQ